MTDRAFAGQRSVSKMADDSAIQINQDTDTKGIKQCDFVIETDDVLTAEAVDSRCQTAKSVSENLAEVPVVIYERQKNRKTEQADGIPKPSQGLTESEKLMEVNREKDKGNEALKAGDYKEALVYYSRSISLQPTAASYNNRALAYLKTQDWVKSMTDTDKVLKLEPDNIKALLRRATAWKALKQFNKAMKDLNKVLEKEPKNKRAQDLLKEVEKERKEKKAKDKDTENSENSDDSGEDTAAAKTPLTRPVYYQKPFPVNCVKLREEGNTLFKNGQYGDAISRYSKVIGILENIEDQIVNLSLMYSNRAACQLKTGDLAGAVSDCTRSLQLIPHSVKPLFRRAMAYEHLERSRLAYIDYRHVLLLDWRMDQAHFGTKRCQELLNQKDGPRWREKFQLPSVALWEVPEIIDVDGKSTSQVPPAQQMGTTVQTGSTQQNNDSASEVKEKTRELSATEKFKKFKAEGNEFVKKGQYSKAVSCYNQCMEAMPDQVAIYTNRALCNIKLNEPFEAEEDCTYALSLEKDNVKALFRRAQARKLLRKNREGIEDLNQLLKVDPKNTAAKKEMEELKKLWREELDKMKKDMPVPLKEERKRRAKGKEKSEKNQRKRLVIEEMESDEEAQDFLTSSMSLSTLYKEIEDKAKVDRSNREIQDITSAVEEMLKRLVSGEIEIEYRPPTQKFRGADLRPCGSMAEETSLWKSTTRQGRENKFLEFDYVVILHNEDNEVRIESGYCKGCRKVVIGDRQPLDAGDFNKAFLKALYSLINCKCSCHVDPDPDQTSSKDDRHDSWPPCPECTVAKDTGRLQIAKIPGFSLQNVKHNEGCSIVFFWTSHTDCLLAPNIETLQTTERIGRRLVIRVDILSAFTLPDTRDGDECEKELLIIGKPCPYCDDKERFMVSCCMQELRELKRVSDQHRQCFIIIKFLYGQFIYWTGQDKSINSYHAKVAFLTHCQTCTDEQKDCTTCITKILQSLVEAYRSRSLRLPEFHPVKSLVVGYDMYGYDDRKAYQIPILCPLHVLPQLKTQHRPCHVVGLIKRTCRILLEQDRPGIMDMDGRPLENTVSTEDILVVLLADKQLCFCVVYDPCHDDVKKLYHHRPCPEPEIGLLRWRATCMAKMIMASVITHIRDETIKQAVEDVQDYVKKTHERGWIYKQLLFLTSSQSVTGMPKNDPETSSLTPSLDGSCNDTTGWNVPTDSIFTDDLQLNWSALNFTEQQIQEMRRLAIELQEEERRLAEETERRWLAEETERERREMIQKLKSKKDENETTTDADQMQVQPTDVIHEVDSSGETDDESALKNGEEDTTINLERKTTVEKKGDRKRKDEAEGSIIIKGNQSKTVTVTERTDNRKESRLEIKARSVGDICEGFYDPEKKWYKTKVIKIISQVTLWLVTLYMRQI